MTPRDQLNRLLDDKLAAAGLCADDQTRELLWLARSGRIKEASYDDAWDAWEAEESKKLDPAWYRPDDALAQWMREHWDELQIPAAPHLAVTPPATVMDVARIRSSPTHHFEACSRITMKDGVARRPTVNIMQAMMFTAYDFLCTQAVPIKIIALKPRQSGGSEGAAELCYFHSRDNNLAGFAMADTDEHTDKIWTLLWRHLDDPFEKQWGNKVTPDTEKAKIKFRNQEGKMQEVEWNRGTAGTTGAGSAGTRQILWLSESGRYPKGGAFQDSVVIGNALNSLPKLPTTLVIAESTAEGGPIGWHHDTFAGAVDLGDRIAGRIGNGWVRIFVGWHQCDDYQLDRTRPENAAYFNDDDERWASMRDEERAGVIRHRWTPAQIAWRREKIVSDLKGDIGTFRRDFPSTPEEAWASAGHKCFNVLRVAEMMEVAAFLWKRTLDGDRSGPVLGGLMPGGDFVQSSEDIWLWISERPEVGRSYLLVCDPMTGEQSAGSPIRDCHAVGVLRPEYTDGRGVLHPLKLVAAIYLPEGNRWDTDILAEKMMLLARHYGGCPMVVEVNKGDAVIKVMRERGATNIYRRHSLPTTANPSNKTFKDGYETNSRTRRQWVEALKAEIRERTIEIAFLPAVLELDSFIQNEDGRYEAAAGKHDDWVAMLGIGVVTIEAAKPYLAPIVKTPLRHNYEPSPVNAYGSGALG